MPLDHVNGEHIGKLGVGKVAPLFKWSDTPFFEIACEHAEKAFLKAGALRPISFDTSEILVMEYPMKDRLAFLFCRNIAGTERLYPFIIKLEQEAISDLVNSGRWERPN
jgi:hypothetical protein